MLELGTLWFTQALDAVVRDLLAYATMANSADFDVGALTGFLPHEVCI
jgi:hypothetical protein